MSSNKKESLVKLWCLPTVDYHMVIEKTSRMSNDTGQCSWSNIWTDHLTAFSLKHLLLLLRTSFLFKSFNEFTVFGRNHLPPRKKEQGFRSARVEEPLGPSDTGCPASLLSLRGLTPDPGVPRPCRLSPAAPPTTHGPPRPWPDLIYLQNGNKNHMPLRGGIEDEIIHMRWLAQGLVHRKHSLKCHLWALSKSQPISIPSQFTWPSKLSRQNPCIQLSAILSSSIFFPFRPRKMWPNPLWKHPHPPSNQPALHLFPHSAVLTCDLNSRPTSPSPTHRSHIWHRHSTSYRGRTEVTNIYPPHTLSPSQADGTMEAKTDTVPCFH